MKHSKLSASGAHRWIECPGSVGMTMDLPETTNEAAEYGTKAHGIVEAMFKGEPYPTDDEKMVIDCQAFIEYVRRIGGVARSEVKLSYAWVTGVDTIDGEEDSFGTSDFVVDNGDELHIVDFKYGMGKVYALENYQLILYALGALKYVHKKVIVHIYQPRIDWLDVWEIHDVRRYVPMFRDAASKVIDGIANKGKHLRSGDHCYFCKAKGFCPELTKDLMGMFKDHQSEITNADIALILNSKSLIKAWLEAIEEEALRRANDGNDIPGFVLKDGKRGNRKWVTEKLPLTDDVRLKTVVRSVSEVEKILPRKGNEEIWQDLDSYITQEPAKQVLVLDSTSEFEKME
jgi:hypothetical protein